MNRLTRHWLATCLLFLLITLCSACTSDSSRQARLSTAQALQTQPTPNFIIKEGEKTAESGRHVCTVISQENLWQTGDDAGTMTKRIEATLKGWIDDTPLEKVEITQWNSLYPVFKDGKVAGTYGDWIGACLSTANLPSGLHIATIRFTPQSGAERSYSWVFQIQ